MSFISVPFEFSFWDNRDTSLCLGISYGAEIKQTCPKPAGPRPKFSLLHADVRPSKDRGGGSNYGCSIEAHYLLLIPDQYMAATVQ
jgi:hypothetical protein